MSSKAKPTKSILMAAPATAEPTELLVEGDDVMVLLQRATVIVQRATRELQHAQTLAQQLQETAKLRLMLTHKISSDPHTWVFGLQAEGETLVLKKV